MVLLDHLDEGAAFMGRMGGSPVEGAASFPFLAPLPLASVASIAAVVGGAVVVPLLLAVSTIILVAAEDVKRPLGPHVDGSETLDPGHGGSLLYVGELNTEDLRLESGAERVDTGKDDVGSDGPGLLGIVMRVDEGGDDGQKSREGRPKGSTPSLSLDHFKEVRPGGEPGGKGGQPVGEVPWSGGVDGGTVGQLEALVGVKGAPSYLLEILDKDEEEAMEDQGGCCIRCPVRGVARRRQEGSWWKDDFHVG